MEAGKVTPLQEYIIAKHSRMVGRVLDLVEAAMPEGTQCEKLKKLAQVPYMISETRCSSSRLLVKFQNLLKNNESFSEYLV